MASHPQIAHVVMQTRRFDAMLGWYARVFDARVVHGNPAMAFMTFDDEHHRFAFLNLDIVAPGGPGQRGDIGVNHVAWTLPSAASLMTLYRRLKGEGILPVWPVHHGLTLSLYYADPDGNQSEFQVEALPPGEAARFIAGPDFAANPVGVAFDPDTMLARFEAGADEAELLAMPDGPPTFPPPLH
jgi:catechol 2,3-dioxygenase-like lactoylglutathione lyase family enzyme